MARIPGSHPGYQVQFLGREWRSCFTPHRTAASPRSELQHYSLSPPRGQRPEATCPRSRCWSVVFLVGTLFLAQTVFSLLCPHTWWGGILREGRRKRDRKEGERGEWEREREEVLRGLFLWSPWSHHEGPTIKTSSQPNDLPKALHPKIITSGIKDSTFELEGGHNSINSKYSDLFL